MADGLELKVEGIAELQSKIKSLGDEFQNILADAVSEAAAVVEREAKLNAVRGGDSFPHRITGTLVNSIKEIRTVKTSDRVESQVGSDIAYAARLEFGFSGTDSRGRRYTQKPRAYLRPALDENTEKIQAAFEAKLMLLLSKYK